MLLNEASDVLYVGSAGAGDLEQALSALIGTVSAENVVAYRWFTTETQKSAESLLQDWIDKYQPNNQAS